MNAHARYQIGQIIHHRLFDYRGVIFDADATFQGTDEWYESVARSRPPKNEPWYHILVHGAKHATYVAECNLENDTSSEPIQHPALEQFFQQLDAGKYIPARRSN